ncbi:MAG: 4-alpha-glucanotransferase [Prevotellaceae bacterium]|jgi:4-alpha-glucanotransferase|nr:4-alpha-glucanotransferase [Prevotellaceae bacterium]
MNLIFHIEYRTSWGEEVRITSSAPQLKEVSLQTVDGIHWTQTVKVDVLGEGMEIHYLYHIYRDGKPVRTEWNGLPRTLYLKGDAGKSYRLMDSWKDLPEQQYFYTSAFTESLMAHPQRDAEPRSYRKGLLIKAYAPCIDRDHCLALCGNQPVLGNWDADHAVPMSNANFPEWQIELDASKLTWPVEYKFIIYNKVEKRAVAWENNPNRYLADPHLKASETIAIGDRYVYFPLPDWKGAGVAVPVFSLRSEKSFGVGDFGDLRQMVDWAALTGQKVVQILPVNDTTMTKTWTDSYPYNSISIYAFHPMYVDLSQLGTLDDKEKMAEFERRRQELNALPLIDYEAVNHTKWEYFRLIYRQEGIQTLVSDNFRRFFESNREWLLPYSAFSYLRDLYGTPDFREWPAYQTYCAEEIEKLCRADSAEYPAIAIYFYLQYHLHCQLLEAGKHARTNGVVLKGDIPIGISRNSVEAWKEPYYFNLNGQAGAPPDAFSVNGQNWGFPTYNWDVMEQDGYAWWMKRFRKMSEYFDAYRIDHILGFFRIWEIPISETNGLSGQFQPALPLSREEIASYGNIFRNELFLPDHRNPNLYHPRIAAQHTETYYALNPWEKDQFNRLYDHFFYHRHNEFWRDQAMKKLPRLTQSTRMLVCGEDLGMIPDCVPYVMNELRILSLEIQRMPKDPSQTFGFPDHYPYRSVCTISTHDMSPLRAWWEEDPALTQRYYNEILGYYGAAPATATPELCEEIIRRHLRGRSMLCILALQDWLSIDGNVRNSNAQAERINIPADSRHYWRWRMHLTLEELLKANNLNDKIKQMIG